MALKEKTFIKSSIYECKMRIVLEMLHPSYLFETTAILNDAILEYYRVHLKPAFILMFSTKLQKP